MLEGLVFLPHGHPRDPLPWLQVILYSLEQPLPCQTSTAYRDGKLELLGCTTDLKYAYYIPYSSLAGRRFVRICAVNSAVPTKTSYVSEDSKVVQRIHILGSVFRQSHPKFWAQIICHVVRKSLAPIVVLLPCVNFCNVE